MDETIDREQAEPKVTYEQKLLTAFRLYDYHDNDMITTDKLGTVLRLIGCVPTEKQIQEIVQEIKVDHDDVTMIHIKSLTLYLKKLLLNNQLRPYSGEELLKVFKIIDPKNRGYIPKDEFVKILTEIGEPLDENTLKEMLKASVDPITLRINYEEYINKITHEPDDEDSIFKLAALSVKK